MCSIIFLSLSAVVLSSCARFYVLTQLYTVVLSSDAPVCKALPLNTSSKNTPQPLYHPVAVSCFQQTQYSWLCPEMCSDSAGFGFGSSCSVMQCTGYGFHQIPLLNFLILFHVFPPAFPAQNHPATAVYPKAISSPLNGQFFQSVGIQVGQYPQPSSTRFACQQSSSGR